jgi:murein DD-endopeptidase MepM/ murein hydrolase activator NlpD
MAIKLIVPVNGPITQLFGENPDFYKKWGYAGHNGIDYGVPNGTPVGAAAAGTVAMVSFENGGYGNFVKLSHMDGSKPYFTYYAHLSSTAVTAGQKVKAGTIVGYSNNTGASTGPHLHFGVKIEGQNPAFKGYVDPMLYFTAAGGETPGTSTPAEQVSDAVTLPNLRFEVTSDTLNVRNGPGIEYAIVGQLQKGAKITGKRLQSKSVWVEFEPGKWCALAFDGTTFAKILK